MRKEDENIMFYTKPKSLVLAGMEKMEVNYENIKAIS